MESHSIVAVGMIIIPNLELDASDKLHFRSSMQTN
jgi:hypothetical protein